MTREQQTNADRIRAMNDMEMARWLIYAICKYVKCGDNCPAMSKTGPGEDVCMDNILHWLAQPAKEE